MDILDITKNCRRIGISGHENPDGDCAGACCGMALFLRKMRPDAQVDVYLEKMPEALMRAVPGSDTIIGEVPDNTETYDAFIILDCTPDRTGSAHGLYKKAAVKINIDHHITNSGSEEAACFIDANASSACELVYTLIDKGAIDAKIAQALYVGMVTDTGVFQYSNTSESTMRAAGHLMSYGFDFSGVVREVFFERTFVQAKVLGTALVRAQLIMNGKVIFCVLDRETMRGTGAERKDLDGISAQLALTSGVDCSVFVHETDAGEWRVSMRSVGAADVSRTAALFGGGGHVKASGCTIRTDIGRALEIIKRDLAQQLGEQHI